VTRRLLNLLTVASLVLFVAAMAVWADANFVRRKLIWVGGEACGYVTSDVGNLFFAHGSGRFDGRGWNYTEFAVPASRRTLGRNFGGFRSARLGRPTDVWSARSVPFWSLTALTAILPGYRLAARHRAMVRSQQTDSTLCLACGYDLRATPDRCPECGAEATRSAPAKSERQDAKDAKGGREEIR